VVGAGCSFCPCLLHTCAPSLTKANLFVLKCKCPSRTCIVLPRNRDSHPWHLCSPSCPPDRPLVFPSSSGFRHSSNSPPKSLVSRERKRQRKRRRITRHSQSTRSAQPPLALSSWIVSATVSALQLDKVCASILRADARHRQSTHSRSETPIARAPSSRTRS